MKAAMLIMPAIVLTLGLATDATALGQVQEDAKVRESIGVFNEVMAIPAGGIPRGLLKDAHGVAIIPGVIKGSFVVGARFGKGVLLVRDDNGGWHAPVFVTLTGGNIGWQVGVQATDVVLVFKTRSSVNGLLSGKFTIGADAAAAAGPVGRQAAAATDGHLAAEIYSYSRSRGLFAGVSFDGSVIQVDSIANASYYRAPAPGAPVIVPEAAQQLVMQVTQYTGVLPAVAANPVAQPQPNADSLILAQQHSKDEAAQLRDELGKFAPELYRVARSELAELSCPAGRGVPWQWSSLGGTSRSMPGTIRSGPHRRSLHRLGRSPRISIDLRTAETLHSVVVPSEARTQPAVSAGPAGQSTLVPVTRVGEASPARVAAKVAAGGSRQNVSRFEKRLEHLSEAGRR